jgi:hypothetical protein
MEKQFEYVNNYYGLKLRKHSPVVEVKTGKRGQVVKGDGAHIHIQMGRRERCAWPVSPNRWSGVSRGPRA